jgi:hypothetical protein
VSLHLHVVWLYKTSSWVVFLATHAIPFTLATTLPAIQAPHSRFSQHHFQSSLTPPYCYTEQKLDRSWSAQRNQRGSDETFAMSRLPTGGSRSEQTTPHPSPIQSYPGMQPPQRASPLMNHPVLPPLRQLSRTPPTPSEKRHGNPFHSILNPQAELVEQQRSRRRSGSQMESPSPIDTQNSHSLPSISRPTSVDSTNEEHQAPRLFPPPGRPSTRHILSPKSPRIHRTQSLNLLNPPTGTIDAHQSPFLTASTRPSDPALSHQSLPTPPAGGRPSYFPPVSASGPVPLHNKIRAEVRRPSIGFSQSGSASPIAQYSPYSQAASVASSQFDAPSTPGHYVMRHPSMQMHDARLEQEHNMIAMAPSGQSSIQLMTIKSQQGHNVQIPVDVQAASKVADEKRRRNAGASARFRARRKEKEREASMSISRLEQQLRDAIEDADFYRTERDYFKAIVFQQPRSDRLYVRPTSPRLSRPAAPPSHAPSSTRAGSEDSYADYEEEIREEERNVRRRTSNYHPVSGPPPNEISGPGPSSQGYSPSFPQAQRFPLHEQTHPTGHQHIHMERPVYRNSFVSDGQYENRG